MTTLHRDRTLNAVDADIRRRAFTLARLKGAVLVRWYPDLRAGTYLRPDGTHVVVRDEQ